MGSPLEALQGPDQGDCPQQGNHADTGAECGATKRDGPQGPDRANSLEFNELASLKLRAADELAMASPKEALQDLQDLLDQAYELEPNDASMLMGGRQQAFGWPKKALDDLDQAESLKLINAGTLKDCRVTEWLLGRHEEALQDLEQADRLNSNDTCTLKYRGATKGALDRPEEALQDLEQANRLEPNDAFICMPWGRQVGMRQAQGGPAGPGAGG
eukprot:jgi/Botrbrau1/5092/Bobra.0128s0003.1